jgi:hypothetical protein
VTGGAYELDTGQPSSTMAEGLKGGGFGGLKSGSGMLSRMLSPDVKWMKERTVGIVEVKHRQAV